MMNKPDSAQPLNSSAANIFARMKWEKFLFWGVLLSLIYVMRHLFFIGFMTFVFCFVIRRIVTSSTRRISLVPERPWLERAVTVGVFLRLLASLYGWGRFLGPRVVNQSRAMISRLERIHPYDEYLALKQVRPDGKAAFLQVLKDWEQTGKQASPSSCSMTSS